MDLSSILRLFGVRRLPRHPRERFRVPLGARVVPTGAQGAKNWFVGPSLASQNDVILELFLYIFSLEHASKQILIFLMIFELILSGFLEAFLSTLGIKML